MTQRFILDLVAKRICTAPDFATSHTKAQKYRCPRCSTRTCSLPCYKRHQKWAQCSGKRDPTVYVKRSKLYTAAGVDHDYNFITGIERGLDDAERKLEDHGLQPESHAKGPKHEGSLRNAIQSTKVIIEHAPRGMSRQKQNKTHWLPRMQCIEWSVQWLHEDSSSYLDLVKDDMPLSQAHLFLVRRLNRESKKRKRDSDEPVKTEQSVEKLEDGDASLDVVSEDRDERVSRFGISPFPHREDARSENQVDPNVGSTNSEVEGQVNIKQEPANPTYRDSIKLNDIPDVKPGDADQSGNHYYLVKPRTLGNLKVLIPLSPNDVLSQCLKRRIVLEFPTIQVLPWSRKDLPNDYLLEEDYHDKCPSARQNSESGSESDSSDGDDSSDDSDSGSNPSTKAERSIKEEASPSKRISNSDDIYSILSQSIM